MNNFRYSNLLPSYGMPSGCTADETSVADPEKSNSKQHAAHEHVLPSMIGLTDSSRDENLPSLSVATISEGNVR